jgi:hypothetical protein
MDSRRPAQFHETSHKREKAAAHLGATISLKDNIGGRALSKDFTNTHIRSNAHL